MRVLLTTLFVSILFTISNAQTFTFACMDSSRLTGINCDVCPVTNITSRSFCGLLIYRDSIPYKWIDQPYTARLRPGSAVEYLEQIPSIPGVQTQDKITIALAQTPFFTAQGMIDSTVCHCGSGITVDTTPLFYASDSIGLAPIYRGDTLTIVGRGIMSVDFDSILQKYIVTADTTGLGGGGGGVGLDTLVAIPPAAGFTIAGSPAQNSRDTLTFTLANDLAALEALSGTGIIARTAAETYALRTITAGTGISMANGDGVAGNPTITNTAPSLWTDGGVFTYLTSTTDRAVVGSSTELNTSYILQAKGGLFVQGAGSTSATFSLIAEKADGTDVMKVRNDGLTELINVSAEQLRLSNVSGTKFTNMMTNSSGHTYYENTGGSYLWGSGSPEFAELFRLAKTFSTTGAQIGMNTQFTFDPSADVSAGLYGHQFRARYIGTRQMTNCNTFFARTTITNTGNGNYIAFRGYTETSGSANATNLTGANFQLDHSGSGTIGSFKGFEMDVPANAGTMTNTYGIYIGDITIGTQTNTPYSIITTDANARQGFSGNTQMGGTGVPSQVLHVVGNARVTGAYYDSNNDPGTAAQVLSSTATGTDWVAAPAAPTILTLNNGLTLTGTNGQWGGALVQNTTIDGATFYQLHKDGKKSFMRYEGNPFTDVNVTGGMDITGKAADPSINTAPSEDNIMTLRGHNGTATYYANAMFFGTYTTATWGSWIQTRSESAYTTHYPLNLNVNGGKIGVGRDPNTDQLDAHFTISRSLSGSTITGILLHIENTEGNKAAMSFGKGYDIIDGEIGYFDTEDIVRVTNRNTATSSQIRLAIGGETTDRVVLMPTTAASNARLGVGFNNTTDLTSTILSKGSLGAAALSTSGAPTFDETKFFVVYTAAGNQTYTLPAQADCKGRIFWIQNNSSAGTITLSVAVKKANGATFNTLAPGEFCQFISDGGDYWGYKQTSL